VLEKVLFWCRFVGPVVILAGGILPGRYEHPVPGRLVTVSLNYLIRPGPLLDVHAIPPSAETYASMPTVNSLVTDGN